MITKECDVAEPKATKKNVRHAALKGGGRRGQSPSPKVTAGPAEEEHMPERGRYTYTAFAHAQQITSHELGTLRAVLRSKSKAVQRKDSAERHASPRALREKKPEKK
jgi:hypothetical protein